MGGISGIPPLTNNFLCPASKTLPNPTTSVLALWKASMKAQMWCRINSYRCMKRMSLIVHVYNKSTFICVYIKSSFCFWQSPYLKCNRFSSHFCKPQICCHSTFDFSHAFSQMVPPSELINILLLNTLVMTAHHHTHAWPTLLLLKP